MLKYSYFLIPFLLLLRSCDSSNKEISRTMEKPNIIYILADDLGYGELGVYGQEKIETPNIDALAKEGMIFTQHYTSAPVCAPARYMLLTGKHAGHSYIRGNDEWAERGDVWNYRAVIKDSTLEGQRPVPKSTVFFPKLLKERGYATGMVGKWGLGAPHTESIPTKMGFDFFYGYNCQRQAHTYYPVHLYRNENRVYLNNDTIAPRKELKKGADPLNPESYKEYRLNEYTPKLIFDEMMMFIDGHKTKPFFMYWASPIPHNPIQAPQKWVDYYKQKFGSEEPYLGQRGYFPNQYPRAAYAAMISYLDENVGKLIDYLKKEGLYENTLIMFSSDNGVTYSGGTDGKFFNSSGEFGEAYGEAKGFVYEGGIRVPMIATWPGYIQPNTQTDHISAQYDVMATLSDIVEYETPSNSDGISFLPTLLAKEGQKDHEFLFWEYPEYGGQVAIRMGDWKVVRQHLKDKETPTLELYNLKVDPSESHNIANKHPDIIKKAALIFEKEHENASSDRFRIPMIENGLIDDIKSEFR
ncbi:N-sulfoglucosamine sulfohydrolase [Flagellimonas maritima]|uniref:N-sulfoglucosamine sulfohydrolase n=1 Tax=Flagellimonas maritima TaxID=1383885 RepID=A0A2Z4LPD3_9FLAO|nr:arylsulfatase [Allomuricauda aurantiaca]AWX43721.1 N-sulfoglucosamine sulfohydrolase [Allomuricauda aurantiaca]